jgi:Domain of unknown function (DUF4388)
MDQNLPLTGKLDNIYLSEILENLQSTQATGILTVERDSQVKSIYLKEGQIVFASSNLESDRLGEMLLKSGKLSRQQYEQSVEALKNTGKRQGAVLVELGFLTPKELFEGLKYQVLEILYSIFLWKEGRYQFAAGELPRRVIPIQIDPVTLISEAIKRVDADPTA